MVNFDKILFENGWKKRNKKISFNFVIIESKLKFIIPLDYKYYAENFFGNEGFIENEYLRLWDIEKEFIEKNNQYEIFKNLKHTVGIGDNGSGEFIAIHKNENNEFKIILCPFIEMEENNFLEIGNSFSDFLGRLENGKSWF